MDSHAIAHRFHRAFDVALPTGVTVLSLPHLPGASAALAAQAAARRAPVGIALAVVDGPRELELLNRDLCALSHEGGTRHVLFPAAAEDDAEAAATRIAALRALRDRQPDDPPLVIAATLGALGRPVPDPQALAARQLTLRLAGDTPFAPLADTLAGLGYVRLPEVEAPGQFAVRGGILDVWPPASEGPVRAEFFGDTVEALRIFDPATQRSTHAVDVLAVDPCAELDLPLVQLDAVIPTGCALLWLDHAVLEQQADLLHLEHRSLPDWKRLRRRFADRMPALELFGGDPPPPNTPAMPLDIAPFPGIAESCLEAQHPDLLVAQRRRVLADLSRQAAQPGQTVILCGDTAGALELIARECPPDTPILFRKEVLSGGFVMPGLTVVAQPDLYAVRRQALRRPTTAVHRGARVEQAAELQPGELVVHIEHGIGRFIGATEIEIDSRRSEVFTVEYADGARLHVPVSQLNLLSRYVGVGGHAARLHRLGGKRWTREKADAERAVQDLAASLLETQARRNVLAGFAFDPAPQWMHEFEAAFPYQETVDQERVIAEVKADMAATRPMDRLICGDAGYGKTEIAMRAAFIAVMNQKQVAVLVPTTVLAEQHYETFSERMAAYPVTLAAISRFRSPAQRRQILADAAAGKIDIVIGTHALLSADAQFKELGLLIIDEEQRFGVTHKERLKQVRGLVDVLTLSATPIPRTLYLGMTGARDMSQLQTPPRERQAVETRVARDSDAVLRGAIVQELNRDGQVYVLYNRVLTLGRMRERLERLVPEAHIAIAHGQMPAQELADVMHQFETGEAQVLLCTTIVESGIDIPRANTIIIHRADRFGIADLYQLRGRVGRSSVKAYAWMLLPEHGHVDSDARSRIQALQKHSGLGAGFNLALRDLEIRGAGNLLGAAQSGHIAAIGFGLYCQLLRRTVARLKGENPPLLVDVALALDFLDLSPGQLDTTVAACLPYDYIDEECHRIAIHRRLAEAADPRDIKALRADLDDRYGKTPPPVQRLLRLAELRIRAARRGFNRIETRDRQVLLFDAKTRQPHLVHGAIPIMTATAPDQKIDALLKLLS